MANPDIIGTKKDHALPPGPVQLAAVALVYILVALALILSYSIAEAAPTWDIQLLTRRIVLEPATLPAETW